MPSNKNIAVLISGGGTTLKNLIQKRDSGLLAADIVQVVSSNAKAPGNEFARQNDIPLALISRNSYGDARKFSDAVFRRCRDAKTNLVVMAGFIQRLCIPPDFQNRVINIHPSLIPSFSGKGFHGNRVHAAVIEFGCKISGCTVHFVDDQYDHGPIIAQETVRVEANDTVETLQQRVFETECRVYPTVINSIVNDRVSIAKRSVTVH